MKVLVLYEHPPLPAGLSTQGALLIDGLRALGVEAIGTHFKAALEKTWYYRWFAPDCAVGVGFWGYSPHLVTHPNRHGVTPIPWLVADGFFVNYLEELNSLPLVLVTSRWVGEVYTRDGLRPDIIETLPVGCDTDTFRPRPQSDPKVALIRELLGVKPDELFLLTVGGDAASKGGREVMRALAEIGDDAPPWRYICKVWPQSRTDSQNAADLALARDLGIADRVRFTTGKISRDFMPYLLAACDIYVGPSRLEGFGMPHVEAMACGKPVLAADAMAFRDTIVHGETGLLAAAHAHVIRETVLSEDAGYPPDTRVVFDPPRVADYRANVSDVARHLHALLNDPALRARFGAAGRERAVACFDYRVVARQFIEIAARRLPGIAMREGSSSMPSAATM